MGLSSLMNIGQGALLTSQAAIDTTGNNIANVNTKGYSRRTVRIEEKPGLDSRPGQVGTGVNATEVIRYFDKFIEEQFHDRSSQYRRWDKQNEIMKSVESLFNESSSKGLNAMLTQYFKDWQDLTQRADDPATREALLSHSENLINLIRNVDGNLQAMQTRMDDFIQQDVNDVNKLIKDIAELNRQIQVHDLPGSNNANTLLDQRNKLVRDLAEKIDIDVIDNGSGDFVVNTKAGHTLVDGPEGFSINFTGAAAYPDPNNAGNARVVFEGNDEYEYKLEMVTGGGIGTAEFRVSLDGGKSWLKDANGVERRFAVGDVNNKVSVEGVEIYFAPDATPTAFNVGDTIDVVPKSHLTWVTPTTKDLNITPQQFMDGTDNSRRVQGGSLAAYFTLRDHNIGRYRDKMDGLADSIVWEVNRLHSQGAGPADITNALGTYSASNTSAAMGTASSGLHFWDRMTKGNMTFHVYDSATGKVVPGTPISLDFDPSAAGFSNFDPATHSLEDVRDAINNSYGTWMSASISNGQLEISANAGYDFKFGQDSTGAMAALGLNTFFKGEGASDIALRDDVRQNTNLINTGKVNGQGQANAGDNSTALSIAGLVDKPVQVTTAFDVTTNQTIQNYYNSIVGVVGADASNAKFNASFNETLAKDLNDRQNATSGVNLDEEMTSLVKFQSSYKAAAKLITTADQMMQTLLGLKQ